MIEYSKKIHTTHLRHALVIHFLADVVQTLICFNHSYSVSVTQMCNA